MSKYQLDDLGEISFSSNIFELKIDDKSFLRLERKEKELITSFVTSTDSPLISRIILGEGEHVYLEPCLPDLPMVIKPTINLSISPGCTLNSFISVPMVFKLSYGSLKKKKILQEFPVKSLSRSWFGDPESGEIAYFLESSLLNSIEPCTSDLNCIHCPVSITNKTNQILTLERMILRVPYLTIYQGGKNYYSNMTKIAFRGQDQLSQINMQKTPPEIESNLILVSTPRLAIDSGVLKKSFYFIKTLYEG